MAMAKCSLEDREFAKFREGENGETCIAVTGCDGGPVHVELPQIAIPEHFNGTATTTPISIPPVAGNDIKEILIKNKHTNNLTEELFVSFDAGATFFTLLRQDVLESVDNGPLKQVQIKGSSATVDYEIIVKRYL